jgi:hypothetical protein
MDRILGVTLLVVFLCPLYFVYKDFKKDGFRLEELASLYFTVVFIFVIVAVICYIIGFGFFLMFGG